MNKVYIMEVSDKDRFPKVLCKVRGNDMDWDFIVNNHIPLTACPFEEEQAKQIVGILGLDEVILRPVS